MEFDVTKLAAAEERRAQRMDGEDRAALSLCLLSAGALAGLSVKNPFARKLLGLGCTILTAGLAVPLAKEYLDQLGQDDEPILAETGEEPDPETLFEAGVKKADDPA